MLVLAISDPPWPLELDGALEGARPPLIILNLLPVHLLCQHWRAYLLSIEIQGHGVHNRNLALPRILDILPYGVVSGCWRLLLHPAVLLGLSVATLRLPHRLLVEALARSRADGDFAEEAVVAEVAIVEV